LAAAIKFEGVTKHYRGPREYRALRDDLVLFTSGVLRRRRTARSSIHAIDDVSFEVPQGSAVALMGLNGSGKTTALKLMSRITYPTTGRVRVWGRVGALIEVGTGLHPELSGRENISLYGVILGLRRRDVVRRFDEIVDFAEIGHAIDQPVKQYSSGMQLRLGFSLAAHLQPDVLLVDEAISVGDAGFQFRCLERISALVETGVTLLFVSHIPDLVASLCRSGILLDGGRVALEGPTSDVVSGYLDLARRGLNSASEATTSAVAVESWDWRFTPARGRFLGNLFLRVSVRFDRRYGNPKFGFALTDGRPGNLIGCSMLADGYTTGPLSGVIEVGCALRDLPLEPGPYAVWFSAMAEDGIAYLIEPQCLGYAFLPGEPDSGMSRFAGTSGYAPIRVPYEWQLTKTSMQMPNASEVLDC
jgi:ABC-type polysaccharide/polyol phosphate transport system ATPase subunit